jgi:predicted MFS family arabinose efflux permease
MANLQASGKQVSLKQLLTNKELRWPLIITVLLMLSQQFSGINAVFFYSAEIFMSANIPQNMLQYAILSTGIVIFFTSIICMFLVDKLGRRNLLIIPIIVIIIDFIALTTLLSLKVKKLTLKITMFKIHLKILTIF